MNPLMHGASLVFAALTGLCIAACLFALASLSWWAPVFAGLAWACFECYREALKP